MENMLIKQFKGYKIHNLKNIFNNIQTEDELLKNFCLP